MAQVMFSAGTFEQYSHRRRAGAVNEIASLPARDLEADSEQRIRDIVERHRLSEVQLGDPTIDTSEVAVRANRFESLGFIAPGQNVVKKGTRITIAVPFTGSADLLRYQPRECDIAPNEAQLEGSTISIHIDRIDPQADQVKQWRDKELERLHGRVASANKEVARYNQQLEHDALTAANERLRRLKAQANLKDELNK